jgi:hypothetical protein
MRAAALGVLFALTSAVPHAAPAASEHTSRHIRPISPALSARQRWALEKKLYDDLETGRIRKGDRLVDVVAKYDPDLLFDHDGYTVAVYAGGHPVESLDRLYLIAKDGRLVRTHVSTCSPRPREYFNELSEEEWLRWWNSYLAVEDSRSLVKWAWWWAKP